MDLRFFICSAWKTAGRLGRAIFARCALGAALLALLLAGVGCRPAAPAATPALVSTPTPVSTPALVSTLTPVSTPTLVSTPAPVSTATLAAAGAETAPAGLRRPGPLRIMPLGDSLTGGGNTGASHSYRGYLEALLREAGYEFDFVGSLSGLAYGGSDPDHEGHGSFTIGPDDIRSREGQPVSLYAYLEDYLRAEPDVILLLIGVNDLYAGEISPGAPQLAAGRLTGLVERIQALRPGAAIFVASLTPVTRYDVSARAEFQALNAAAQALGAAAADDGVYFVDLYGRLAPGWDPALDLVDGVHYSERGARKVAQVWFEALAAVYGGR